MMIKDPIASKKTMEQKPEFLSSLKESSVTKSKHGERKSNLGVHIGKTSSMIKEVPSINNANIIPKTTMKINAKQVGDGVGLIQPKQNLNLQCDFKRTIIEDTEESFFINPQYKIEVKYGNKLILSLLQEDKKKNHNNGYIKCNFILMLTKGRHTRVWDVDED